MAIKPIELLIRARDQASGVLGSINGRLAALTASAVAFVKAAVFVGAVRSAGQLEAALSRVQGAASATKEELAELRAAAEHAGSTTQYTSVEAAGALENLVKSGLSARQAIAALPSVLSLAQAGNVGLGDAAAYVTQTLAGMNLQIEDSARVADVLALGANASNTSVTGLAQALGYAAPAAAALKLPLETTVALLGNMANAGIDASRGGTALAAILAQFSDPASQFRAELQALGIYTNDFDKALHQLAERGERGEKAILAVGLNAGPGLRALLNQGMPALDALKAKLDSAEGSAAAAAATMTGNMQGAAKGLSSAWSAVLEKLGTPVLPAVTDAINSLASRLRSFIADGTVGRFGEAMATTFRSAAKWAQEFIDKIDFEAVSARLGAFADRSAEAFTTIGERASQAGHAAALAWNAMAAGTHTVMTVVYKVAEAFSGVASNIQAGLATIMEGLAKITFGGVSAAFSQAAAEVRESAEATWAVSEAFAERARQSFNAMAERAQGVRDAWQGVTSDVGDGARAQERTRSAVAATTAALEDQADAAGKAGNAAAQAAEKQRAAAEQTRVEVERMRAQYRELIADGQLQDAAELLVQIERKAQQAATGMGSLADASDESAERIKAAFAGAGIQTKAELAELAERARADFNVIKASGQATAEGLATAWRRAADAAIAANNGIAPAWVQAEASVHGYIVAVNEAGSATVQTSDKAGQATDRMAQGWHQVTQATREAIEAAQAHQREMNKKYGRAGQSESLSKLERGWAKDESGNAIGQTKQTWLSIYNMVKGMGLSDEQARGIADQAYPNGQYSSGLQKSMMRSATDSIDVTEAARRAAEKMIREGGNAGGVAGADNSGTPGAVAKIVRVEFSGKNYDVDTTTPKGQQALDELLRDMGRDKRRAA